MRFAFEVLDAWGFELKTILTWVKDRMGTGDWLRGQTEHCILAIRGKPTVTLTDQTTLLQAAGARALGEAGRVLRPCRVAVPSAALRRSVLALSAQ